MKKIAVIIIFILAGVSLQAQTLTWDIKLLNESKKETILIGNRPIITKNGEIISITITPAADCFAYIILYNTEAKYEFWPQNGAMEGGKEKTLRITIEDPPGTETLSVIISLKPQSDLERRIQAYNSDQNYENRRNLRNEISSLQLAAAGPGEPPSTLRASGGTTRGNPEVYDTTRFTDRDMYVRTINISH